MRVEEDINIKGVGRYTVSVDTITGIIVLMVPGKFGRAQGHTRIALPKLVVSAVRDLLALSDLAPGVEELMEDVRMAGRGVRRAPLRLDGPRNEREPLVEFNPPEAEAPNRPQSMTDPDGLQRYDDGITGGVID